MSKREIIRLLLNANTVVFFTISVLLTIFSPYIISFLNLNGSGKSFAEINDLQKIGEIEFFVISILIVPVLETVIFQSILLNVAIWLLKKIKYNRFYIPIIFSGVIFGLSHLYNLNYLISASIMGLVFAFTYRIFMVRKGSPFLIVTGIHSISNLIVYCIHHFL